VQLPWGKTTDAIDIAKGARVLDEDHYDLEKVKDRIVEYLAVGKLKKKLTGPILCFVGPPGVGKTSLGQSIAGHGPQVRAPLGRRRARRSRDPRPPPHLHRRDAGDDRPRLRDAGTNNPVMMIDEIDKVGSDYRGDPQSALLEVLDPEQNNTFRDHYLDLPFDLSQVLFVCTANELDTISPPLRDRMEIIQLSGYTEFEKLQIAKRYLVKKQREANGCATRKCRSTTPRSRRSSTTTRARPGVRNLEREIGTCFRKVARKIAEEPRYKARVKPENSSTTLEAALLQRSQEAHASVGVATGLAWTPVGGDIMFIETTRCRAPESSR
jgi:ATP-dependent Lon protease